MYIDRSRHHTMLYVVLFGIALVFGLLLGILLPMNWIEPVFRILADIAFKVIIYFTVPYLFFSLLISTYELSKTKKFFYIVTRIAKIGFLLIITIVSISIIIFQFISNQNIITLLPKQEFMPAISISHIINSIFSFQWINVSYASQVLIIPFFVLAIILGINANNIVDARHPLLEVCNGLRAINLKILEIIFPWYSVAVFVMTIRNISSIRSVPNIDNFSALLIFLPILACVMAFIVYPFLIKMNKIPIRYWTWCQQIIPVIGTTFAGGNITTATISLFHVEDVNNPSHKVTDTTLALSFVFLRVGTAVTIALSYIMISKIYTAIPLSALQLGIILVGSIALSYLSNAISFPIIFSAIVTLSQIPSIIVQDLYYSIIPLGIILHGFASVIDGVTCGFVKLYLAHIIEKTHLSFELHFMGERLN